MEENVFAIYKPKGPTSAAALNRLKKSLGVKKIGHAGTLDPLARGVLVVGINGGTKQLTQIVQKKKEYLAEIRLGMTSETDDEEGEKKMIEGAQKPTRKKILEILKSFQGETLQRPPIWSALKVKGKEAYKLARQGQKPDLPPRPILIKEISLLDYRWPDLKIRVVTGPGVYVRSLARDIGEKLGVGGYLTDLERIRVGQFTKENALRI